MKKAMLISMLVLMCFVLFSCGKRKDPHAGYDVALNRQVSETITMDTLSILISDHVILAPYNHPEIEEVVSFDMTFEYDYSVFEGEHVSTWGGGNLKLTVKASALRRESFETEVVCRITSTDNSYSTTVTKKVIVPPAKNLIGYLYVGSASVKSFSNYEENGFYMYRQSVSSGHFYTDYITELDFESGVIKYKVDKYEKSTGSSYNHKINSAIYYFDTQSVSINNGPLIKISDLDVSDNSSFERSVSVVIKNFDKVFISVGLTEYVSCLSK